MYVKHDAGKRYKDIFDSLNYGNKVILNELSDCMDQKSLNRLAKRQILTNAAASVLENQNKNEPTEAPLGADINVYCDRICEDAPKAGFIEKLLAFVRNTAAFSFILSVIVLAISIYNGYGVFPEGIFALKITGVALVSVLCFPLICYRDAMHMPGNLIIPRNAASAGSIISMVAYSLLCIVCTLIYAIVFWVFPSILMTSGFGSFRLDIMAWVITSAAIFAVFIGLERYAVKRNYNMNNEIL